MTDTISDKLKDHILDSIGEGVFTVDKDFKINFFNKSAERITGFNRNQVLGKFCKHVFHSEICFSECPIAIVLKSKKNIYDFESTIQSESEPKKKIKLNAAVLYNEIDEPTGGIISFRDISPFEVLSMNMQKLNHFYGMIGHSKQMQEIYNLIEDLSETSAPVLISGESGTGKELVANAIQKSSNRKNETFIKINCSVFPPNLLASELFGHVKGAFTDAVKDRPGRFELADKGTIFLDEVAEMPPQMQIQLLRVLQEGTFERVGESFTRHTNVRVIAATNVDIKDALQKGKFREDLFFRLNVIPINVPPLRERKDDIPPLIYHFLDKFSLVYKKEIHEIEDEALEALIKFNWHGNIRELENVIEFAFVRTSQKNIIEKSKLPSNICDCNSKESSVIPISQTSSVSKETTDLLVILEKHKWNKTLVSKELGIGRTTLWRKMKRAGIIN